MRLSSSGLFGSSPAWRCEQCIRSSVASPSRRMISYRLKPRQTAKQWRPRRGITVLAAGGATLGLGSLAFADDIKFGYAATERTGRVMQALYINVKDYRTTLKKEHSDPQEKASSLKACHKRCAERTLRVLEKNGSIFIKLGQHLSSMGYLLPPEWVTTFVPLQDKCPVSPYDSIEAMFIQDTGHRIEDDFDDFSRLPIGAASLAQVHTATSKETGQKVAVKVQHPALAKFTPLDLALTKFCFSTLKRVFPEYDLEWLSSELEVSLPQELDFSLEGKNAIRTSEYFKKNTDFPLIIPDVISARPRILVMQYVTGHRPDDLKFLDSHQISRSEVSATLARIFNTMIFADGCPLHCDPHGGNLAIQYNPTRRKPYNFDIILYDHGLYRDIPLTLRRNYARLWLAVIDGNIPKMRKYAYEVAGITDEQFPIFASAITGRDYRVLTKRSPSGGSSGVVSSRTSSEQEKMSEVFGEDLLPKLVQLLGQVPRIILLILKTNDLTRSLDDGLQTGEGPERTFMILAKYASRTVYDEDVEKIWNSSEVGRKRFERLPLLTRWPRRWVMVLRVWLNWKRTEVKLWFYERFVHVKRALSFA